MSKQNLLNLLIRYRKAGRSSKLRRAYLRAFESKMIYRTTKTENSTTTLQMVNKILHRFR